MATAYDPAWRWAIDNFRRHLKSFLIATLAIDVAISITSQFLVMSPHASTGKRVIAGLVIFLVGLGVGAVLAAGIAVIRASFEQRDVLIGQVKVLQDRVAASPAVSSEHAQLLRNVARVLAEYVNEKQNGLIETEATAAYYLTLRSFDARLPSVASEAAGQELIEALMAHFPACTAARKEWNVALTAVIESWDDVKQLIADKVSRHPMGKGFSSHPKNNPRRGLEDTLVREVLRVALAAWNYPGGDVRRIRDLYDWTLVNVLEDTISDEGHTARRAMEPLRDGIESSDEMASLHENAKRLGEVRAMFAEQLNRIPMTEISGACQFCSPT